MKQMTDVITAQAGYQTAKPTTETPLVTGNDEKLAHAERPARQNEIEGKRSIPAKKIANLKRRMDGAEKRVHRLERELVELRSIIRRKYIILEDKDGGSDRQVQLSSAQVSGYRLKRIGIEGQLLEAKGDYFLAKREYQQAVKRNTTINRVQNGNMRSQYRVLREAKKLLRNTVSMLQEHGSNGGSKEIEGLRLSAQSGDVRQFRQAFDSTLQKFDPLHYATISGVSTVKTEIVHALMDQFKNEQPGGLITGLDSEISQ